MNKFWTVVGFTFRNKVKAKSYVITTIIMAIIFSVLINLPYIISQFSSDAPDRIGYAGAPADLSRSDVSPSYIGSGLGAYFKKQEKPDYEFVPIADADSADATAKALNQALENGDIDAYIVFADAGSPGLFPKMEIRAKKKYSDEAVAELQAALQSVKLDHELQNLGLSDVQKQALFSQAEVSSVQINVSNGTATQEEVKEKTGAQYSMVYAIMFLLLMTIMSTGMLIATEITAEKSSRVMEVLVTSVSPLTQMFGKIFGMFIVGLMQIALYVIVFAINLSMPNNDSALKDIGINMADIPVSLYIYALLFYLIGYFLFATLYAGVGSLVSRTEELGQAVMPLTFLSIGGFYIGIFGLNAPGSTFVTVASFIPFFTPYIMFLRIGMVEPPFWQIAISLAALLVTTLASGWLSAKIYRTGVLMYGKRPSLKELRKAMKAYKL
ncbi:ABC transporter permease [Paenibacillus kobensis]|uniref:ABC transporter permease n=1 Tax=Paenibacillus kobensis TaxID=59841 RepID=UPI000FDB47D8|nr:ABC transporter permease [Paenibacillus kobensis]